MYSFNLGNPVNPETNVSELLLGNAMRKRNDGLGANFEDGAMLANDHQYILYGGILQSSMGEYKPPDDDEVLGYQFSRYGAERFFEPDWDTFDLGENTTRNIAYGGAANAPSENKAWYFSGMTRRSGGQMENPFLDDETRPRNISNFLIEVDMEIQDQEVWTNRTLEDVKGRVNPEVVWVPVGEQGILVVLGGVVYPHWTTLDKRSEDKEASVSTASDLIEQCEELVNLVTNAL